MCGIQAVVSYCERDYSKLLITTTFAEDLTYHNYCLSSSSQRHNVRQGELCVWRTPITSSKKFVSIFHATVRSQVGLYSWVAARLRAQPTASLWQCVLGQQASLEIWGRSVHRRGRSFSRGSARRRSWNYFSFCSWLSNSVGISLKELAVRCRNVWNFAQGLKFKTDFHSTMSVCRHMNWGVEPPIPGNSNSAFESVLYW